MFFYRKNYGGEWVTKQLKKEQKEEVINKMFKMAKELYERIDKEFPNFNEERKNILFEKMFPTFESIASDILDLEYYSSKK